ncbi:hypothetical protein VNO77_22534 [Canavalia gladiata]|uniref:Uncharacterized protein n=1 Tax=Canavalia gladiata TaxID=3824 RepID=A0AAN9QEJ5_CANGL
MIIVVVRSLRKRKVVSSILAGGFKTCNGVTLELNLSICKTYHFNFNLKRRPLSFSARFATELRPFKGRDRKRI